MLQITKESLRNCASFVDKFIKANYSTDELAKLLDTSMTIISFKRKLVRWTLRELEVIFNNKGYELVYEMGNNLSTTLRSKRRRPVAAGKVAAKYDCKRLKFLQDYIALNELNQSDLLSTGHYPMLAIAFRRDDMRYSYLLSLVSRLNAELRIDITPLSPENRTQFGGLQIVSVREVCINKIESSEVSEEGETDPDE